MSSMDLKEAISIAYAKSTGETIREHTNELLKRLDVIKNIRGKEIISLCPQKWRDYFWDLAKIVIEYHDYGKLHSPFQKKIISKNKNLKIPYELKDVPEVPHNFLSPCFLPEDILKKYEHSLQVIIQAIAYHHNRDVDEKIFKKIIEEIAKQDLERFKNPLFLKYWQYINPQVYISPKDKELFKLLVLLKGLLHRVDYTASGDIDVEKEPEDVTERIKQRLKDAGKNLNKMQEFVLSNSDKDLLIISPTGSGKTEAGVLYIDKCKGFFVLPLRVSINSIYDKLTGSTVENTELKYGLQKVGLMHSTSLFKHMDYIEKENADVVENIVEEKNFYQIYRTEKEAKNLSFPFNITTPDQIFPFVFKYGGFERVYFTLGYSKIVIDEIQMYNPSMLAYILKGLQVVKELGGKIMIMTATFPQFLKEELSALNINFSDNETYRHNLNIIRHNLKVEKDKDILDYEIIQKIQFDGEKKKVLVICNTVDKAIKVYEHIKFDNKFLLHSRFIQKHRKILETDIQNFAPNKIGRDSNTGIWITTQIAEVSLDIDFDVLYTELSSIDSLIQRMGRVNRAGRYEPKNPNIIVCCKKKEEKNKNDSGCSGIGNIYNEKIFDLTKEKLIDGVLTEDDKMKMVEQVYNTNSIKETDYYKTFKKYLELINEIWEVGKIYNPIESLREAQKQFREIFTITLIPQKVYSDNSKTLEDLKNCIKSSDISTRENARKELVNFTVTIPYYYLKNEKPIPFVDDIYIVQFDYNFDENQKKGKGLSIKLDESNMCD